MPVVLVVVGVQSHGGFPLYVRAAQTVPRHRERRTMCARRPRTRVQQLLRVLTTAPVRAQVAMLVVVVVVATQTSSASHRWRRRRSSRCDSLREEGPPNARWSDQQPARMCTSFAAPASYIMASSRAGPPRPPSPPPTPAPPCLWPVFPPPVHTPPPPPLPRVVATGQALEALALVAKIAGAENPLTKVLGMVSHS